MNIKTFDLDDTVYSLCTKNPELVDFLAELGFSEITKPGMLNSAGRFMTLRRGAAFRRIPIETVVSALEARGFDTTQQPKQMEEIL
jgi:hypothetical protein